MGGRIGSSSKSTGVVNKWQLFMVQILTISSSKYDLFRRELAFFLCFFFLNFAMDG